MKKWRNKILSAVLVLSLLLTSSSFAFAVGEDSTDYTQVKIEKSRFTEKIPSSVHSTSDIENAFDTNADGTVNNSIWHTSYDNNGSTTDSERFLIIKFDKPVNLSKITFLPRQDGNENGRITKYEITAGNTLDESRKNIIDNKVISGGTGTWVNDANEKTAEVQVCDLVQYVKLRAIESNGNFICAANIAYYENIQQPVITEQPQGGFAASKELHVTAKSSSGNGNLKYQWYTLDGNGTEKIIDNETNSSYTAEGNSGDIGYFVRVTQGNEGYTGYIDSEVVYVITPTTGDFNIADETGGVTVIDCSSEFPGNGQNAATPKENAIDNNDDSFWETDWGENDYDRYITFDLGNTYYLSKIEYLPRKNSNNGAPKILDIYTSIDGDNWTLAKTEDWSNLSDGDIRNKKTITFNEKVRARYVKFHAVDVHWDNNKYTYSLAEVDFFAETSVEVNNMITEQPKSGAFTASTGVLNEYSLSINVSEGSTIQWYSNTKNSYLNATFLSETKNSFVPENTDKYYFAKVINGNNYVYSDIVFVEGIEAKISRTEGDYYGTLSEVISNANSGERVEILKDIHLTTYSTITLKNKEITITSSGDGSTNYKIQRTESTKSKTLFAIGNGGHLILDNVTIDGGAIWSGNEDTVLKRGTNNTGVTGSQKFFDVSEGGELNIINGTILQNNDAGASINGSIIAAAGKNISIIINNSTIKNNSTRGFGTVLYARTNNSSVTEEEISNIRIENSEIYGNSTSSTTGGTILLEQKINLDILGGEIRNNNGGGNGGAIYMFGQSNVTISQNTIFNGNKAASGGAIMIPSRNENNATVLNLGTATFTDNISNDAGPYNSRKAGNAIMYFGGLLNITDQPTFTNETQDIFVGYNAPKYINIKNGVNLSDSSIFVTPQTPTTDHKFAVIDDDVDKKMATKAFKFPEELNLNSKTIYVNGTDVKYGNQVSYSNNLPKTMSVFVNEENNMANVSLSVTATGTDVTYQWYKTNKSTGETVKIEGADSESLTDSNVTAGTYSYYCLIDNGEVSSNEPVKSNICEVKVSDFYPCSKAIDKFKNI